MVKKPAVRPTKPVKRITGAKPPFPTYDGESFSQVRRRAGPAAATAAPVA